MSQPIIGIDIDGVLADFNTPFKDIMVKVSGRNLFGPNWTPADIHTWNYPTDQYGYTKEEYKAGWDVVKTNPVFWQDLKPFVGVKLFLNFLDLISDPIYFITQRNGISPKTQTENWLINHGHHTIPTVLISGDKAGCCKALGITHYVDDKVENCQEVYNLGVRVRMVAQGWNHELEGIPRDSSVIPFLDEIVNACQPN